MDRFAILKGEPPPPFPPDWDKNLARGRRHINKVMKIAGGHFGVSLPETTVNADGYLELPQELFDLIDKQLEDARSHRG